MKINKKMIIFSLTAFCWVLGIGIACTEETASLAINIPASQKNYSFKSILDDQDWIWRMRATEFYMTTSMTEPEIRHRLEVVKKLGYNTILNWGNHYRFCAVPQWDAIEKEVALITKLAHEAGLRVIEHHSALATTEANLNDEWNVIKLASMKNINAKTGTHDCFSATSLFLCPNNPDYQKAYESHVRKLLASGIDALMSDDIEFCNGPYVCACKYCREKFKQETGLALPSADDNSFWMNWSNPNFRKWIRFRQESAGAHHARMKKLIEEINPNVKLLACHCQPTGTWLNVEMGAAVEEFAKHMDILFLEAQNYAGYFTDWPRHAADMMYLRSLGREKSEPVFPLTYLHGRKTYELLFGSDEAAKQFRPAGLAGYEGVLSGKMDNQPGLDEQYFVWALDMMFANRFWLNMGSENILKPYKFEDQHLNQLYLMPKSIAGVGIVYSRQTRDFYGGTDPSKFVNEWFGWCTSALVNNIPYQVLLDEDLEEGNFEGIRAIILPNVACMSEKQAANLMQFVKNGGRLILDAETSLYNATGNKLSNFQLVEALGFSYFKTVKKVKVNRIQLSETASILSLDKCDITLIKEKEKSIATSGTIEFGNSQSTGMRYYRNYEKGWIMYSSLKLGVLGQLQSPARIEQGNKSYPDNDVKWQGYSSPLFAELMREALLWGVDNQPLITISGQPGIIVTIQKVGRHHVVQLLNASSAIKSVGDVYNPNEATFPELSSVITVTLSGITANKAVYMSPDIDTEIAIKPKVIKENKSVTIEIPAQFRTYGAVMIQ